VSSNSTAKSITQPESSGTHCAYERNLQGKSKRIHASEAEAQRWADWHPELGQQYPYRCEFENHWHLTSRPVHAQYRRSFGKAGGFRPKRRW
jgi:hypothetical protein